MKNCKRDEKIHCEKLSKKIDTSYFFGNALASGTVTDISEDCMCINTKTCLPLNAKIELLISSHENFLNVSAKIRRVLLMMEDSKDNSMTVEVLNPTRKYLEFVNTFRKK
jgi:hypothetical protein